MATTDESKADEVFLGAKDARGGQAEVHGKGLGER